MISQCVPELQVSFMSRYLSLTDEALRPNTAPMEAQSEPCFMRSLHTWNIQSATSITCNMRPKKIRCHTMILNT